MLPAGNLPNARGFIEGTKENAPGVLAVSGWMLSTEGPFDEVRIDTPQDSIKARIVPRPDVAKVFPNIANAVNSGFQADVTLHNDDSLHPPAFFPFLVVGMRSGVPVAQMTGGYYRSSIPWIPPNEELMYRVAHTKYGDLFYTTGMKNCIDFLCYVKRHVQLGNITRVLDWGCGCGRLTPHLLACLPSVALYGTDIDREAVEWCASQFPQADFRVSQTRPPLPYADRFFDLILATSVFTHLTRDYQRIWLTELARILAPGGLLLATTHGEFAGRFVFPDKARFEETFHAGICDKQLDPTLGGIAPDGYYRATFQSKEYTVNEWGHSLKVVDYIEAGHLNYQDVFLLAKNSHEPVDPVRSQPDERHSIGASGLIRAAVKFLTRR
jgi:SAM-dependent methyltransferase